MATATKKCKVCGAEYEYCHTNRRISGVFRWQDVSCCPEHGSIYLERIEASRRPSADNDISVSVAGVSITADISSVDDDDDDWFEDDFDDEDDDEDDE